jgi:hypothetical protein
MKGKKANSQALEEIEAKLETKKHYLDIEHLSTKISIRDITFEEKIQEACKPLYLKRYE